MYCNSAWTYLKPQPSCYYWKSLVQVKTNFTYAHSFLTKWTPSTVFCFQWSDYVRFVKFAQSFVSDFSGAKCNDRGGKSSRNSCNSNNWKASAEHTANAVREGWCPADCDAERWWCECRAHYFHFAQKRSCLWASWQDSLWPLHSLHPLQHITANGIRLQVDLWAWLHSLIIPRFLSRPSWISVSLRFLWEW